MVDAELVKSVPLIPLTLPIPLSLIDARSAWVSQHPINASIATSVSWAVYRTPKAVNSNVTLDSTLWLPLSSKTTTRTNSRRLTARPAIHHAVLVLD